MLGFEESAIIFACERRCNLDPKIVKKHSTEKEDLSIPPVFPATFYKLLVEGARRRGVTRAEFAMEAAEQLLIAIKSKKKNKTALVEALQSEELAERVRAANSQISKQWWSKLSAKEKTERARKAVEARWGKRKK